MTDAPIIQAFKQMQVPLMIVGPDGAILHCNRASCRLFGYGDGELIGHPIFDVLSVASVPELNALIEAPAIDAIVRRMTGRNRSGNLVQLAIHMTAWSDAESGLQHALVLRDITDEMELERQSKDELKRANNAIQGARIGVFEYNPDADTVIVSDIWRELLELDKSDEGDVQVEWRARVHPDDLDRALEPMKICLEGINERASCEYRFRVRTGTHWRWMRTDVAVSRRENSGRVIRVIGAMADITDRKRTEEALHRSIAQFKSAFDNATVGKAIVGLDGCFLRVNPALCEILGYSESDLLQTDFQTLTHSGDLDEDLSKLDLLKAGQIPSYRMEKRYIRSNGAAMWGLLSVGLVRDADGRPDHFISQIVDVTEQRRLSELKSEFVATVSHELRTPLTSILGSLALLSSMDTEPFTDEAQRLFYIAQENGKRLHALVNDILDFEKFSSRQMRFSLIRHQIVNHVEEAVLANMASADKYGVKFHIKCPDRSLAAWIDPKRFQQVMTNLLSNAAKFADTGSKVSVAVERNKKTVQISVSNEGAGIPDAFRDQIFKPFAQAAAPTTRTRGGTGLGLNITKQIVELTGGKIGFDSPEGGRTTFWFTVPMNQPA